MIPQLPIAGISPAPTPLDPVLVVGLVILATLAVALVLLAVLHTRLTRQRGELAPLARLEAIEALLRQLAERESELDLRRLEHVLIDLRDLQQRLEDRLLTLIEARETRDGLSEESAPGPTHGAPLSERVISRLLAMGYERVEILTPHEELERFAADGSGEVVVEGRRDGALHKGRVLLRDGALSEVKLRDSYEAFP